MQATTALERDCRQDQFPTTRYTEQDEFPTACSLPTTIYIEDPRNIIGELDQPVVIEKLSVLESAKVEIGTFCGLRKRTVRLTVFSIGFLVVMGVVLAAYYLGSKVALSNRLSGSELKRCVCIYLYVAWRDEGLEMKMHNYSYVLYGTVFTTVGLEDV